jgi:hypothetical protein
MKSTRFALWRKVTSLSLALSLLGVSCAEVSRMNTVPEGATLYIDGIPIGETPAQFRYRSGLPQTYYVKIEMPGYKSIKDATIDRTFRADVSLLLLVCAIVPYFFSARLEDQYVWNLLPAEGTQPPAATPATSATPTNPLGQ